MLDTICLSLNTAAPVNPSNPHIHLNGRATSSHGLNSSKSLIQLVIAPSTFSLYMVSVLERRG